jgi:ribonuclease HII
MQDQKQFLVGIDEAGRGPIAGPVAVGVAVVPIDFNFAVFAGVKDSKKLSAKAREVWIEKMKKEVLCRYEVALVGSTHIDAFGIVHAITVAMKSALERLNLDPNVCEVRLDGSLYAPKEYIHQTTIIKGDVIEPIISLASIAAKVHRDHHMMRLAKQCPEWLFDIHKGYGTKKHYECIHLHGLSPAHRKTFLKKMFPVSPESYTGDDLQEFDILV